MHVRADTASLHAACTSVGGEPDQLLLQTDWGIWPSRKKTEGVTPPLQLQYKEPGILTHDVTEASLWNNTRWGVLRKQSEDHYAIFDGLGYEDDSNLVTLLFFSLVSPNNTDTPVTLSKEKPKDIQNWKREQLLVKDYDNVQWFVHPRTFFTEMDKKNRLSVWDRARAMHVKKGMSDKGSQVAVATAMSATAASLNPYVVQRCRADRALDPDASWQTDGWGKMPQWLRWNRRSNSIAPEPISAKPSARSDSVMIRKPSVMRFVQFATQQEKNKYYERTSEARFNFIKETYWTTSDCDQRVACKGLKHGHIVYMCYWKLGALLLQCYINDDAFKKETDTVLTINPRDYITLKTVKGHFDVPKNGENVIWFTDIPYGLTRDGKVV